MKGVVILGNRRMEVRDFPDPVAGAGEVVVQIKATGVCGCSREARAFARHHREDDPQNDIIAGHEASGVIIEIGAGVRGLKIGQGVIIHGYSGCGHCEHCRAGWPQHCPQAVQYGTNAPGSWAEYQSVPAECLVPIPAGMNFQTAAACACSVATGFQSLQRMGARAGDILTVFGAGNIGLATVVLGNIMGLRTIAVERGFRLQHAAKLGAWECVDNSTADPVEEVLRLTSGKGSDFTFDADASHDAWTACASMTAPLGAHAIVGEHAKSGAFDTRPFIRRGISTHLSWSASRQSVGRVADLLASVSNPMDDLVTHTFPLPEAQDALELYETYTTGKVEIVF